MTAHAMPEYYRGWRVVDNGAHYHPVTGRWRAVRFGVGMGTTTREGLIRMIDARVDDEQRERRERERGRTT